MCLRLSVKGSFVRTTGSTGTKKADVAGHPVVFGHVGLLFSEPPGITGLLFV
jgi:hypothetical protein